MRFVSMLALVLGLSLSSAPGALAGDSIGVRATVFQQGTNVYSFAPRMVEIVSPITVLPLGAPLVELLVPVGGGDLLIGTTFHRNSYSFDQYGQSAEGTLTGWIVSVGYAAKLVGDDRGCVRAGGRLGMALMGKVKTEYDYSYEEYDYFDSGSDTSNIDSMINATAFLAGEMMPSKHFGLGVETGLSVIVLGVDEVDYSFVSTYAALSGIIRF
jgi:hypothetical protein